jgi:hypothetical protein
VDGFEVSPEVLPRRGERDRDLQEGSGANASRYRLPWPDAESNVPHRSIPRVRSPCSLHCFHTPLEGGVSGTPAP